MPSQPESKKIVWCVLDGQQRDIIRVWEQLRRIKIEGYEFIVSQKNIELIPKEELIKLLERIK